MTRKQYDAHWHLDPEILADYFMKHHLAAHYIPIRPDYLHMDQSSASLLTATAPSVKQGYVGTNTHKYCNFNPLPVLPVVHDTWATKPMYPEAYICAWTPIKAPIACY